VKVLNVDPGAEEVVEVAAALVFREGKLLITRRLAEAHLGGLWEFPGGKKELAESYEECLTRELREELGIEVEIGGLFETITHVYPGKAVLLKFFKCRWRAREPEPLACEALAWVGPRELGQYVFPAADAKLLDRLKNVAEWLG
jgi:mutator protein MutT